jgi:hypothetical protein
MKPPFLWKPIAAWLALALGAGVAARGAQVEVSPGLERLTEGTIAPEERAAATASEKVTPHEAILAPAGDRKPEYADKAPPEKIVERPGERAPSPAARWIEGYWDWNKARRDYEWVTGTWRIPPGGRFWVDGYWRRQENGWSRVPGFWSERRADPAVARVAGGPRDWRNEGPPAERPAETPGPAPNPDSFYIPGDYVPRGEGVVWKPGYWYRSQPGWEWNPARWVRLADGWVFREGSWSRVAPTPDSPPANEAALREATIVSTPAGTRTSGDDPTVNSFPTVNSLMPISAAAPSIDTLNPTAGAPSGPSTTASPTGAVGNADAIAAPQPAASGMPDATARPGQLTGTTQVWVGYPAPGPAPYGLQPMYSYPSGGMPSYYPPQYGQQRYGGSVIDRFLSRFLPY